MESYEETMKLIKAILAQDSEENKAAQPPPEPEVRPNPSNDQWFYYNNQDLISFDSEVNTAINNAFHAGQNDYIINANSMIDFGAEKLINETGTFNIIRIEQCDIQSNLKQEKSKSKSKIEKLIEETINFNLSKSDSSIPKLPPLPPAYVHCKKTLLYDGSSEYKKIRGMFDVFMVGTYNYFEICKLDNPRTKYFYTENLIRVIKENKSDVDNSTKTLFFLPGPSIDPKKIYDGYNESFDPRITKYGAWGYGTHFCTYPFPDERVPFVNSDGICEILVAKVITGNIYDAGIKQDSSMKYPPEIPGQKHKMYDSVKGSAGSIDFYVTYEKNKAYPEYLILYGKF